MLAGYMRTSHNPGHMAKLLAIMCKFEGIDLLYLTPDDITNRANNKVTGKMLINKKWEEVETELPGFIDINPIYFKSKKRQEIVKFLKKSTILSSDKRMPLPKDRLQVVFKNDPDIKKYLIPTKEIDELKDIEEFITKYGKVVIKPVMSNRGRDIYVIRKKNSNYILGKDKSERELIQDEFKNFFNDKVKNKGFIVQKCVMSRNEQGDPFDCRVHVEKDGRGKWKNVQNFIRIGVGQTVISNVSQGGGISNCKKFLISRFGDEWEPIYKEIKKLARILPLKIEKVLGKEYMTFGFDVGIDKDGSLYLFEVNDFPIVFPMKSKIAMARAGYYRYVLENKV